MTAYRCYLLNRENRIAEVEVVEAECVEAAIERGRELVASRCPPLCRFELWQRDKMIYAGE